MISAVHSHEHLVMYSDVGGDQSTVHRLLVKSDLQLGHHDFVDDSLTNRKLVKGLPEASCG